MADARTNPSKRRVWFVTRAISPVHGFGGLERSGADIVKALGALNEDVRVITTPPNREIPSATHESMVAIPWRRIPISRALEMSVAYRAWCRGVARFLISSAQHGDIVHANGASASVLTALDPAHLTLILNPHGMEEFFVTSAREQIETAWLRRSVRSGARAARYVIATDSTMRSTVTSRLQVEDSSVRVVPNGIDVDRVAQLAASGAGKLPCATSPEDSVIVTVGRLVGNKGYDLMPAVLDALRHSSNAACVWWHIGSGELEGSIRAEIEARGLQSHATLFGARSDDFAQAAIARATVFCQPSRYEGSSLTTLEALSHGRPVVATNVGGIPDKIQHEITGLLSEPNATLIAASIQRFLTDPEFGRRCGLAGRELVRSHFSIDVAARQYQVLYDNERGLE
jgi:glycosyltransferase involved in cell wall biosynthesis